ncbi:MFS transporter [Roseibium algae]|uniref:MFS transporter n=1 Tax=Roseibium algae TaxID=3123038 RepID=A0ABU8TJ93_9HYPH
MSSGSYAMEQPTSFDMEKDARAIHAGSEADPGKIALGVIIGRSSEFFDFFVYAIASVLVFPTHFFPMYDHLTGILLSFCVFSLAFIARPIGTVVFTVIDRLYGRGTKLIIALFVLGGSTAGIGFLPGYDLIGYWAVGFLVIFRLGQGFALGGAWDGLASLLALNAPKNQRGWYAMMPQLGAPIGFILASGLFAFSYASLHLEDFLTFGWRYPFFVAFAINVVALFARLRLVATGEFGSMLDRQELKPVKTSDLLRTHGMDVLIGTFTPLASFALFHLVTVFPLSWVSLYSQHEITSFLLIEMVGALICVGTIVLSGILADRIGRQRLLAIAAGVIAIFSLAAPFMLEAGEAGEEAFVLIGFAVLGLSFGQAAGAVSSHFGRVYRYSGAALTSNMAWLIGAGFAPLVALGLASTVGLGYVGLYMFSGAACTLAALALSRKLRSSDG